VSPQTVHLECGSFDAGAVVANAILVLYCVCPRITIKVKLPKSGRLIEIGVNPKLDDVEVR
jgi:hypothetical protein